MQTSYLNRNDLPRGLRNNNPGNLVYTENAWKGKIPFAQNSDGHFEQFESIEWGIRAMMIDIIGDINEGTDTLRQLISEYAPAHENNTDAYIASVSNAVGILPDVKLQLSQGLLFALIRAKITMEVGVAYTGMVSDESIAYAYSISGRKLPGNALEMSSGKKTFVKLAMVLVFLGIMSAVTVKAIEHAS